MRRFAPHARALRSAVWAVWQPQARVSSPEPSSLTYAQVNRIAAIKGAPLNAGPTPMHNDPQTALSLSLLRMDGGGGETAKGVPGLHSKPSAESLGILLVPPMQKAAHVTCTRLSNRLRDTEESCPTALAQTEPHNTQVQVHFRGKHPWKAPSKVSRIPTPPYPHTPTHQVRSI